MSNHLYLDMDTDTDVSASSVPITFEATRRLRAWRNEGGVEVHRKVVKKFRNHNGQYSTTTLDDIPSGDVEAIGHQRETPSITFWREVEERGNVWRRTIDVDWWPFSEFLEKLEEFPLPESRSESKLSFVEPFVELFLRRDALRKVVANSGKGEEIPDQDREMGFNFQIAGEILQFIDDNAHDIGSRLEALKSATSQTTVRYDDLWMLYLPGTLIFETPSGGDPVCYMVDLPCFEKPPLELRSRYSQPSSSFPHLKLQCWSVDYDGETFGRRVHILNVDHFPGSVEICNLRFVPEPFLKDKDKVKAHLKSRGQEFWNMQIHSGFRQVIGPFHHQSTHDEQPRVIVDMKTHRQLFGGWIVGTNCGNDEDHNARDLDAASLVAVAGGLMSERVQVTSSDYEIGSSSTWFNEYRLIDPSGPPDELTLLLCPRTLPAFRLRDKSWRKYDVINLQPVKFRERAWDRLVLDSEYKDVIRAMVKSYLNNKTKVQDLVAGKGAGLVVLLHGPPGVGKTLTAECVAESFKKPLYMVTAGDLGTDPERLESKLSTIFDYAVSWNAILLLDEADIFLQDRDYDNLARNALVSIFLRTLEYFNGIMFLTSNRVGAFDQAFQSRIHITIGMPELNDSRRKDVWKIFIQDLGRKRSDGSPPLLTREECQQLGHEVVTSWASQRLNGRQIRNCVRSALALAEDKGVKPDASHFNTVLRLSNEFTQYMHKLQKAEADEIAQIKGDRLASMRDIMMGCEREA